MSAIAVLAKAETLDEKIVPRTFINDEHLELHQAEMQKLFKMKYTYTSKATADNGAKKSMLAGNVDWRLKISEYESCKSTIRELWTGESKIVEWRFLPQMMGSFVPSHEYYDFDDEIQHDEVFIVKNFMIMGLFSHTLKYLFLNLMTKKLFWMRTRDLESKIV